MRYRVKYRIVANCEIAHMVLNQIKTPLARQSGTRGMESKTVICCTWRAMIQNQMPQVTLCITKTAIRLRALLTPSELHHLVPRKESSAVITKSHQILRLRQISISAGNDRLTLRIAIGLSRSLLRRMTRVVESSIAMSLASLVRELILHMLIAPCKSNHLVIQPQTRIWLVRQPLKVQRYLEKGLQKHQNSCRWQETRVFSRWKTEIQWPHLNSINFKKFIRPQLWRRMRRLEDPLTDIQAQN